MKHLLIILLLFVSMSCQKSEYVPDSQADVEIISFTAEPESVQVGSSSTLTWETKNATTIIIDNAIGAVSASGSIQVSPTSTTTYVLTASNEVSNKTANVIVTVSSEPPPPPPPPPSQRAEIFYFRSDKSTVPVYMPATLSWATANAIGISISDVGNVNGSGSISVNPQYTTAYTLTATGQDGVPVTASFTITVDRVSACGGLGVSEYNGVSGGVKVTVGKNQSQYYSAKNVIVLVKLFNSSHFIIEQNTGTIPNIAPQGYGSVTVALTKWGLQASSEITVNGCDCDLTL